MSDCIKEWLILRTYSKDTALTDTKAPSLIMALKNCQNMQETFYLLCSHFIARAVGLINWLL